MGERQREGGGNGVGLLASLICLAKRKREREGDIRDGTTEKVKDTEERVDSEKGLLLVSEWKAEEGCVERRWQGFY